MITIIRLALGEMGQKEECKKYLGTLSWMPKQLYCKHRKLNCIFSCDESNKSLVTNKRTSKEGGFAWGGFFCDT